PVHPGEGAADHLGCGAARPGAGAGPAALTARNPRATDGVVPSVARPVLRLLVLGDSIAFGTGAQRADDTLGRRLAAALTDDGADVELHVLAVPGAVSADLPRQVRAAAPPAAD